MTNFNCMNYPSSSLWFMMSFSPSGQNGLAALQRAVSSSAEACSPLLLAPV